MSFEIHEAADKLSQVPPLGSLDLPDFELLVAEVFQLRKVFSAGLEIDGGKLCFLSPPVSYLPACVYLCCSPGLILSTLNTKATI